jgi:hypothetical protein
MEEIKKQGPTKRDQLILDYYYKTRINEKGEEGRLPATDLESKREIWSLNKMENLVRNDETLTNRYNEMAVDGPFKFGYHWNEVIMNILFNEYVLSDRRYYERYLNTKEVPKKRRGNPDGKIDDSDFVDYESKNKYKKHNKKKMDDKDKKETKVKDLDETTTTGSAGGAAGYVGYSTPRAFAKNKDNWRFGNKTPLQMPVGSVIVESEDYLVNSQMFENFIKELEEEKRHSAMILKDRISKENEKNFKNDLKINKEISDAVKKATKSEKQDKIKTLEDLEKEQLKSEFKPVKFDQKEDFKSEYDKIPKGMEDLDYDHEPSDKYKERVKNEMGEELYNKGRERVKMRSEEPLYNKDAQPTEDINKYKKKFEESYQISGKYTNQFNKTKIVDFRIDESIYSDNIENYIKLNLTGIGNSYSNKGVLNESIKNILESYEFYYDIVDDKIFHKYNNININEDIDINKYKHLLNYNPNIYVSSKKKR